MEASGRSLRRLTAALLRKTLRAPAAAACVRRTELGPSLAYAISDAPGGAAPWSDAFAAELDGLPLLRLADEHQRYDSVPGCSSGKDGIAVLRTAQRGSCHNGALWLCHKPENRDFPALMGQLTTMYTLDTAAADFLVSVERIIANVRCNVKVTTRLVTDIPCRGC